MYLKYLLYTSLNWLILERFLLSFKIQLEVDRYIRWIDTTLLVLLYIDGILLNEWKCLCWI